MTTYMTEEEQLEVMRKWWRRHHRSLLMGLSVVMLLVAGYRYWNWHVEKETQQASMAYEQMMVALSREEDEVTQAFANQLVKNHENTVYSEAAHLTLAKVFVQQKDFQKARHELEYVAEHAQMGVLKDLAKLRLARLYLSEKQYQPALLQLSSLTATPYAPIVNELRGDIYVATRQYPLAMSAYHAAMKAINSDAKQGNVYLEMKTNAVAALIESNLSHQPVSQTA